jgi:histidinol-phosphate/aromatic aminotransferase/cobyric acid decarboxylase-like protein
MDSYSSAQTILNQKLGYVLGCRPERLQVLHGATQAYPWLRRLWQGRSVAYQTPTFGEYQRMFPNGRRYADLPGLGCPGLEAAAANVDICIVVNPNNPTGNTIPSADLHALAQRHPDTILLVDESFHAFTGQESLVELLEARPLDNVIVLTSLSKSIGAPGLRLGYLYSSNAAFNEAIGAEIPIWNLGTPAEHFLELLLKFRKDYKQSLERTMADRENLSRALQNLDIIAEVYPSGADFVLARLNASDPQIAKTIRDILLTELRIDTKDVSDRFPDHAPRMRFAVRSAQDNKRLVDSLSRVSLRSNLTTNASRH